MRAVDPVDRPMAAENDQLWDSGVCHSCKCLFCNLNLLTELMQTILKTTKSQSNLLMNCSIPDKAHNANTNKCFERIVKAFYSTFSRMQCLRRGVLDAAGGRGASRSLSSSGGEGSGETQVKSKTGVLMLNFISSCAINSLFQCQGTGEA